MRPIRSSSAECASKLKAQAITTSNRASAASRAASTRSARCHRAEFGAEKDRGAALLVPFEVPALGADQIARPRRQRREGNAVLLVRLLHARCLQIVEHHLREIVPAARGIGESIDQGIVGIAGNDAMRRQALDRERPGDANARSVGVGLIVEIFEFGLGRDRGVDLLLPRNPRRPPFAVNFLCLLRPIGAGLPRNLPLFPSRGCITLTRLAALGTLSRSAGEGLSKRHREPLSCTAGEGGARRDRDGRVRVAAERGIEPGAQRLQRLLPLLPDHIDLGIVGDRLQRDVRHPLVDKALADVAARRRLLRRRAA